MTSMTSSLVVLVISLVLTCGMQGDGSDVTNHIKETSSVDRRMKESTDYQPDGEIHLDSARSPDSNIVLAEEDVHSVPQEKVSKEVAEALEKHFLRMFGFNERPKRIDRSKIPQFMLDFYKDHNADRDNVQFDFNVNGAMNDANTIRSFTNEDTRRTTISRDTGLEPEGYQLQFNITSLPEHERITGSELRLFRKTNTEYNSKTRHLFKTKQRIEVHEIIQPATASSDAITRLLDTRVVDPRSSGWEIFEINPAVLKWRSKPQLNHGLQVHVTATKPGQDHLHHVRLRRSVDDDEQTWASNQPVLVTYTDDTRVSKHRTKRSSRHGARRSRSQRRRRKEQCRRHELYVDFSDVGWDDWIVAPPGYNAFYCKGKCEFPIPDYLNATNHAVVQNLVNSVDPSVVPQPCCVPTELSPISMLYLDEDDNVVLKNYKDMVVQGCGCR